MARITNTPSQHPTKLVDFQRLDGGLNLWEVDYRLAGNQSPEMKNLWWQDGVLQCRDGQSYVTSAELGTGYTCFSEQFWDNFFFHIGSKIYRLDMTSASSDTGDKTLVEVVSGVPENRGTFFRYNEYLYYKNRGGFYKISHDPEGTNPFPVVNVQDEAYTPVILLNTDPSTGAGDTYQPENRLSAKKTVRYNAAETTEVITKTGDGTTKVFDLGKTAKNDYLTGIREIYLDSTLVAETLYTVDLSTGKVTFTAPPDKDSTITFAILIGVVSYKLPVDAIDAVLSVKVDDVVMKAGTDYAVDLANGKLAFVVPPPVHKPAVNNTVEVTYSKANTDAYNAILDCQYVTVYGGAESKVCMVMGGSTKQPNAFFWNGNDDLGMNDSYWPITFYQLAGDAKDKVTGFGVQYGTLIVLKERSIGKSEFYIDEVDERDSILLTYVEINSKIGCDLPWTIQLIENNILFCNTSGGVHLVRESTAALENNIECISRNVNGTAQRPGLLHDVKTAGADMTCSFDDDNHYWVCSNGKAYVWDYLLSAWKDPSWFYFTNINGIAYIRNVDKSYHLDPQGRVTLFERVFMDYGGAIEKVYQFPPQFFDTYDRLKDILHCIFTVRSDTDSVIRIQYQSDYETRFDLTDIQNLNWRLTPRNLAYRSLSVRKFAYVARRIPGCRRVRHFSMRLTNNEVAQDMAILSAQIYFRYLGRDR